MKNLKRVLSLALVLVMLLGMFVVVSAADETITFADLTDNGSVVNKDAVSLCVDLGIIKGIKQSDGTCKYEPTKNIDRASWATLVYYVSTGDADFNVYKGNGTIKDASTSWAEGAINYLASLGILSGDTNGYYHPEDNVKVVEAAKMLLTAIGYNSKLEGFENDKNWSTNIMKMATKVATGKVNLLKGSSQSTANELLTRDNAAQMIYNALFCNLVEADYTFNYVTGERVPSGYKSGTGAPTGTLGENAHDLVKVVLPIIGVTAEGKAVFNFTSGITGTNSVTTATQSKISVGATPNDVGLLGTFYVTGTKTGTAVAATATISKDVITVEPTVVVSFATGTGGANLDTILVDDASGDAKTKWNIATTAKVYKDGADVTTTAALGTTSHGAPMNAAVAAGNVVTVYDVNGDKVGDIVKITCYQVAKVGDIKVTAPAKEGDVETTSIGNIVTTAVPTTQITAYEGMARGDYVLWTSMTVNTTGGTTTLYVIEKAEAITGAVTGASSKGELTVGGKKYTQSGVGTAATTFADVATAAARTDFSKWDDFKTEWTFYLDKGGNIVWAVKPAAAEVETDLVVVLKTAGVAGTGGLNAGKDYAETKVLHMDGTTSVVKVGQMISNGATSPTLTPVVAANAGTHPQVYNKATDTDITFYEMAEDDTDGYEGMVVLTEVRDTLSINALANTVLAAKVGFLSDKTGFTANDKTVFVIGKGAAGKETWSVVTGYKNLPAATRTLSFAGAIHDGTATTVAAYVVLTATAFDGDKIPGNYFLRNNTIETTAAGSVINVVTPEGKEGTLTIAAASASATAANDLGISGTLALKNFFTIDAATEAGVVTKIANKATASDTLESIGAGAMATKSNSTVTPYGYDQDTVFIVIDLKSDGSYKSVSVVAAADAGNIWTTAHTGFASNVVKVEPSTADASMADCVWVIRTAS